MYVFYAFYATLWSTTWQIIQPAIDSNIQLQMERHYTNLNKKTRPSPIKTIKTPYNSMG